MTWDIAIEAIKTSGPVAIVLGAACWYLLTQLKAKTEYYEGDPKDPERNPGVVAKLRKEAQDREDALRTFYEAELAKEREENKSLYREIAEALRGVAEEG